MDRYTGSREARDAYCVGKNGLREGPATEGWYQNGRPVAVGEYSEGVRQGAMTYYLNDGTIWRWEHWLDGAVIDKWLKMDLERTAEEMVALGAGVCGGVDSIVCSDNDAREECKPYVPPPKHKVRFADGTIGDGAIIEGLRWGAWTIRATGGALVKDASYDYGQLTGRYREYYESGRPKVEGEFTGGERTGPWTYYDFGGKERTVAHATPQW